MIEFSSCFFCQNEVAEEEESPENHTCFRNVNFLTSKSNLHVQSYYFCQTVTSQNTQLIQMTRQKKIIDLPYWSWPKKNFRENATDRFRTMITYCFSKGRNCFSLFLKKYQVHGYSLCKTDKNHQICPKKKSLVELTLKPHFSRVLYQAKPGRNQDFR